MTNAVKSLFRVNVSMYVPKDASIVCQQPPNKLENTLTSGTQMTHRRYPHCESVTGELATMTWRKSSTETR
jgi:hypothetical protein